MGNFGDKFRIIREQQGFQLEEIEEETKIRKLYLKAIEDENFSILPPRVYATGFVKRYARFLKLNPDELVSEFQSLAYTKEEIDDYSPSKNTLSSSSFRFPIKNILAAIVFFLLVVWAGSYLVGYFSDQISEKDKNKTPPSTSDVAKEEPKREAPVPTVAKKLSMTVQAKQLCWLQVWVDGEQQYASNLTIGQSQTFEGQKTIRIKAGNAIGIDITLNNKKLEPLGKQGEVKERTFELDNQGAVLVTE